MNPHLETLPEVLILSGMPEELQIHETKKKKLKRVTYLHEARPPIDKDIPEESPIVFERAIKNQMPHCSGSRGGINGRRRGWFFSNAAKLCARVREKRDLPPPPSCRCTALHCRYRALQQGWGLLSDDLPANSVMLGVEHKLIHLLLLMFTCLNPPSNEIRNSVRYFVSSS